MSQFVQLFLNLQILERVLPALLRGLTTTLLLSAVIVPASFAGGLLLALLARVPFAPVRWAVVAYTDLFRAFPPLVLLIYVYYGLPFVGINTDAFWSVILALTLTVSSYFGEVLRAGIEGIDRGQTEAARSTGLSGAQAMRYVVLPQALRNMLPELMSNVLETVKNTSLASVVTLHELLRAAQVAQGNTLNQTPLVAGALIYLVLLWPLVRLIGRMERRLIAQG